jgi:hypothetical protein
VPIIASRGGEIRRLIKDLYDPKRRVGAVIRLKSVGSRVVPHAAEELGRLDLKARQALLEVLRDLQTTDAKALKRRLTRAETETAPSPENRSVRQASTETVMDQSPDPESKALNDLRSLPPPRASERASISRERGEAHLVLARHESRLARKDLLLSLNTLDAERTRLYCEAAGLIGDAAFLAPLARIASRRPEAAKALSDIALREKISARSKALRDLDEPLRLIVAKALVGR